MVFDARKENKKDTQTVQKQDSRQKNARMNGQRVQEKQRLVCPVIIHQKPF